MKKLKCKKLCKWGSYLGILLVGVLIGSFWVSSQWIGTSVKQRCVAAQEKYEGDCVEALVQLVDDGENSLRERNYGIWALGQLGDERALKVLKKYYTGEIPDREPYSETLSQYEMKKAIKWIEEGSNLTALFWRGK